MSALSIYIIEDEPLFLNKMLMLVEKLGYDLSGNTDNSDTAVAEIQKLKPDLILVDIDIAGTMDGVQVVEKLDESMRVAVIFVTSYSDEATFERVKRVNPYAFITKPFDADNLQRTIELALNSSGKKENSEEWSSDVLFKDSIFIKNRSRIEKLPIDEILYLEVEDRYSTVYTEGGKKFVLRMSIGDLQEKLPTDAIVRTHRKYSVNLSKITSIDVQDNLIYIGEVSIPISRSYKEVLLEKLQWM